MIEQMQTCDSKNPGHRETAKLAIQNRYKIRQFLPPQTKQDKHKQHIASRKLRTHHKRRQQCPPAK